MDDGKGIYNDVAEEDAFAGQVELEVAMDNLPLDSNCSSHLSVYNNRICCSKC